MEELDIINEHGDVISKEYRDIIHKNGISHHASGTIIINNVDGEYKILSQQRAYNKDKNPGLFDISAAGHVPTGQDVKDSLLREIKEELGLELQKADLEFFTKYWRKEAFNNHTFIENELDYIYITYQKIDINNITMQHEEVAAIKWLSEQDISDLEQQGKLVKRPFWPAVKKLLNDLNNVLVG